MTYIRPPVNPSHLHIRVLDEEGDISSHGGASIAYHVVLNDEKQVIALCGLSVCSDVDNFNKKLGNKIATSRLDKLMNYLNDGGEAALLTMVVPLAAEAFLADAKVEVKVLYESDKQTYVLIKEEDFPITETLITAAIELIRQHRLDTYEGDDPDVLDAIDEMFEVDEDDSDDEGPDENQEEDSEESDDAITRV